MIFCSKNEDGVSKWKLVMDGTATVTRRINAPPVGAIRAIQPARCAKAIGHLRVLSVTGDERWQASISPEDRERVFAEEAKREGFQTWDGLWKCLRKFHGENLPKLNRIEFKKV